MVSLVMGPKLILGKSPAKENVSGDGGGSSGKRLDSQSDQFALFGMGIRLTIVFRRTFVHFSMENG